MKLRAVLFEKICKIEQPLAKLTKKKKKKKPTQINEREDITIDTTEMHKIIRDYMKNYMPIYWTT